jgi:ESCRT-II complex subunit VPS36
MSLPPSLESIFVPVSLTAANLPQLSSGEVQYAVEENVKLYRDHEKVAKGCLIKVTTHRLIWTDPDQGTAWGLPLSRVVNAFTSSEGVFRVRYYTTLQLSDLEDITAEGPTLRLSFGGRQGEDEFTQKIQTVLGKRIWEQSSGRAESGSISSKSGQISTGEQVPSLFSTTKAGIAGIQRAAATKQRRHKTLTKEAFGDLESLMEQAKHMVNLIEQYTATSKQSTATSDDDKFESILDHMGIANPVTKETSGSVYMQELSRQLADFVIRLLSATTSGGMMQLIEVYCAFNRARGTELVTPEDVLKACKMFRTLKLPLRLAKFESGVLVVQLIDNKSGSAGLQQKIVDLIKRAGGEWGSTTATSVSSELKIALFVAQVELAACEKNGLVVRDSHYDGTVFFLNAF